MAGRLFILGGLPGVGKTSIARGFAEAIGAMHLRIDTIEVALYFCDTRRDIQDEGYRIAYALAADNLRLGLSVVADSVNPKAITRDAWLDVADRMAAESHEIEVICSDVAEHRRRVEGRVSDIAGFTPPSWDEVVHRDYEPWPRHRTLVDTAVMSVAEAVASLRDRFMI